jgi:hypothetical protein
VHLPARRCRTDEHIEPETEGRVRFRTAGMAPATARTGVEYICARLTATSSQASAFEAVRRDLHALALPDFPGTSWLAMPCAALGSHDPDLAHTTGGGAYCCSCSLADHSATSWPTLPCPPRWPLRPTWEGPWVTSGLGACSSLSQSPRTGFSSAGYAAAVRKLGWKRVNVWVRCGTSDELGQLRLAEQDDNALHKPLTQTMHAAPCRELKARLAEDSACPQPASWFTGIENNSRSHGGATVAPPSRYEREDAGTGRAHGHRRTVKSPGRTVPPRWRHRTDAPYNDDARPPCRSPGRAKNRRSLPCQSRPRPWSLHPKDVRDLTTARRVPLMPSNTIRAVPPGTALVLLRPWSHVCRYQGKVTRPSGTCAEASRRLAGSPSRCGG